MVWSGTLQESWYQPVATAECFQLNTLLNGALLAPSLLPVSDGCVVLCACWQSRLPPPCQSAEWFPLFIFLTCEVGKFIWKWAHRKGRIKFKYCCYVWSFSFFIHLTLRCQTCFSWLYPLYNLLIYIYHVRFWDPSPEMSRKSGICVSVPHKQPHI